MAQTDDVPMDSQYMDYAEHERTYAKFISFAKGGTVTVAIIVILMAIFLI